MSSSCHSRSIDREFGVGPGARLLLNGGNAVDDDYRRDLGSFLGQHIGWRGAFFLVVQLAAITFGLQWLTLPRL